MTAEEKILAFAIAFGLPIVGVIFGILDMVMNRKDYFRKE